MITKTNKQILFSSKKMKIYNFLIFLLIANCQHLFGQIKSTRLNTVTNNNATLKADVSNLSLLLKKSSSLYSYKGKSTEQLASMGEIIDKKINNSLVKILKNKTVNQHNIDSILKKSGLTINHSSDRTFWTFSWDQFQDGSANERNSVNFINTLSGENIILEKGKSISAEKIYRLQSKEKNLYLLLEISRNCNTCYSYNAQVIELTIEGISHNYPAFETDRELIRQGLIKDKYSSEFSIETREYSSELMFFNEQNQVLKFTYSTDDLTPVKAKTTEESLIISRELRFNGIRFVGNGYR